MRMYPSATAGAGRRATAVALGCALLAIATAGATATGAHGATRHAARRTPSLAPTRTVIDGPSSSITSLNEMSIARGGAGAVVYTKQVGGVAHVFVSRLTDGNFQAPVQVDRGLVGPSSQPVVAAAGDGLVVAFINAGHLYVAQALSSASPLSTPSELYSHASSPSLAISPGGIAYMAFTATGTQDDVRSAYWADGQWSLGSAPLDASPGASAGGGTGRPQVAAAGDGIGIVTWGEGGHIYARRVIGDTPSTEISRVDPARLAGWSEVSASDPVVSSVGYSTYAAIGYTEQLSSGSQTATRVVYSRLRGERIDDTQIADGATAGQSANQPAIAVTEFGAGFLTSQTTSNHQLSAAVLGSNSIATGTSRVASIAASTAAPYAAPAAAGIYATLIAWQQTPGQRGPAEIRLRYAPDGSDLGAEQVLSNPADGATDAADGLVTGGDLAGDAAAAWVQGSGASTRIVAAQLYQRPGNFAPGWASHYYASTYPTMSWSVPAESWGPVTYALSIDGAPAMSTAATSVRPGPLAQGRHVWQVTATNQAGLSLTARSASVFVDTLLPKASFRLTGKRIVKSTEKVVARARDRVAAGLPGKTASGVALVTLSWGDGTVRTAKKAFTARHAYRRRGRYRITLTVTDRAGNRTTSTRPVTIKAKPKPLCPAPHRKPPAHPKHVKLCVPSQIFVFHSASARSARHKGGKHGTGSR